MERSILALTLKDKVGKEEIRRITGVEDAKVRIA